MASVTQRGIVHNFVGQHGRETGKTCAWAKALLVDKNRTVRIIGVNSTPSNVKPRALSPNMFDSNPDFPIFWEFLHNLVAPADIVVIEKSESELLDIPNPKVRTLNYIARDIVIDLRKRVSDIGRSTQDRPALQKLAADLAEFVKLFAGGIIGMAVAGWWGFAVGMAVMCGIDITLSHLHAKNTISREHGEHLLSLTKTEGNNQITGIYTGATAELVVKYLLAQGAVEASPSALRPATAQ